MFIRYGFVQRILSRPILSWILRSIESRSEAGKSTKFLQWFSDRSSNYPNVEAESQDILRVHGQRKELNNVLTLNSKSGKAFSLRHPVWSEYQISFHWKCLKQKSEQNQRGESDSSCGVFIALGDAGLFIHLLTPLHDWLSNERK